jgi:DNA-binding NarL/FixJ family response regulator
MICSRLAEALRQVPDIELVGEVYDGAEAIQAIQEIKPDVVILDIRLPGTVNGLGVLEEIKRTPPTPAVIMLTNYPYLQYRQKAISLGADYFFKKSDEFSKVVEVLMQLCEERQTTKGDATNE